MPFVVIQAPGEVGLKVSGMPVEQPYDSEAAATASL